MVYDSQTQYGLFMMEEGCVFLCVCVEKSVPERVQKREGTDMFFRGRLCVCVCFFVLAHH